MVNCIEADPFNEGTCYIAATSYKLGDFSPYLYKTVDYGANWTKIVTGISNEHFTRAIRADREEKGILYSGTEQGMYISYNYGQQWYPLQLNLPITPITDITLKDQSLIVSTQGRGIWMIDDLNPIRYSNTTFNAKVFKPKATIQNYGRIATQTGHNGTNHPSEIMLYFYLDSIAENDTISITMLNDQGDTVNIHSNFPQENQNQIKPKSGSNLVLLKYNYKAAKSFEDMILWWSSLNGPIAYPGEYQLIFKAKSYSETVKANIAKDPRYPVSDLDVKKQFDFIKSIRDKLDESNKCIIQMRDVKQQISSLLSRTDKSTQTDTLWTLKKQIDSTMNSIETELYQTKNKSGQDPINFPIKLTNKLAHLTALFQNDSYPPTDQAEAYRKEISELIDIQLNRFAKLKEAEISNFNQVLHQLKVDLIKPNKIN